MLYIFRWIARHPDFNHDYSLMAAIFDGMYFCVMIGVGESFLSPFCIALGSDSLQTGILNSAPILIGALAQGLGLFLHRKGLPRKKIIVFSAILQGMSWFGLAWLSLFYNNGSLRILILLILWIIYNSAGNLGGPSWNSLIGDLIPSRVRGSYFGFRNQRIGWITISTMLIGGWFLNNAKLIHQEFLGFTILFIIAGFARLKSAWWVNEYIEPGYQVHHEDHFTYFDFIKRAFSSNFAKFVLFFSSMNAVSSFSGTYFPLYALRELRLSYTVYSILIITQIMTQLICMQNWGRLCDEFGNRKILSICTLGICFSGTIWIISSNFYFMLFVQLYSGLFWAGFNLSGSNFLFDAVSPRKRAACATYMSITNSTFVFIGTILGGYVATHAAPDFLIYTALDGTHSIYYKIFVISFILRIIIALTMLPLFKEVREVLPASSGEIILRITRIELLQNYVKNLFR